MLTEITFSAFNKDGVPIIKDKDIEKIVNKQLLDFDRNYFKQPHALDIESFIEFYLNRRIDYYTLSIEEDKRRKLGSTALSNGKIPIYRNNQIDYISIKKGEILIENNIKNKEHLLRFTLAHEAGHSVLHTNCSFNITYAEDYSNSIEYGKPKKLKTVSDWIDHHANVYAACLLMPEKFMKKLVRQLFHKKAKMKQAMINDMVYEISQILNVSSDAIKIRISQLDLLN